ncbi:2-keto-3-deoxy-6-phosphogluconate aldolase [Bacilli bacterium PM5-3]|nr:2-keto-3-deoxy-6-phosphogluconate aldolase [Bacilli bacterium PM5-3]
MSNIKFAFILTGGAKHPNPEFLMFENKNNTTKICGVDSIESACEVAKDLVKEGYNLIELCGDFQKEGAQKVIDAVEGKAKIGYVIY